MALAREIASLNYCVQPPRARCASRAIVTRRCKRLRRRRNGGSDAPNDDAVVESRGVTAQEPRCNRVLPQAPCMGEMAQHLTNRGNTRRTFALHAPSLFTAARKSSRKAE